jgi:hypothetical protein
MVRTFTRALAALLLAEPLVAQTAAPAAPPLDFSGLIFGAYSVHVDSAAKASLGGKSPDQFSIDRVYLNFRMPAGDNGAIRVTTDIFQNTSTAATNYYNGWTVRLKYAYFQYTALHDALGKGSSVAGRVGSLQNVIIDQSETFWPRYFQQGGVEHNGFFSSADIGIAGLVTLPNRWGEIYSTLVNGPGYTSYEKDRFKDIALRVSLTPFANSSSMNTLERSLTVVPWVYKGWVGSAFASGGAGQVGPGTNGAITEGMARDRYGLFMGVKEHKLTAGGDVAWRIDDSEKGANTVASPRTTFDSTGRLIDGYVLVRPFEWVNDSKPSPFMLLARLDHLTPNVDPTSANYAGTTPAYNFALLGASYDLTQRITLALDWQGQAPSGFPDPIGTNVRPTPRQSTYFLHWQATF